MFLLLRYVFLGQFIALFFARYLYICRKEGGRDVILYREELGCVLEPSW